MGKDVTKNCEKPAGGEFRENTIHSLNSNLLSFILGYASFLQYPMLIPCAFLSDHLICLRAYCAEWGKLTLETTAIERDLGVTRIGRKEFDLMDYIDKEVKIQHQHLYPSERGLYSIGRQQAANLTVRMNTNAMGILFARMSPDWNVEASKFVMDLIQSLKAVPEFGDLDTNPLKDLLKHNIGLGSSLSKHVSGLEKRMSLQFQVVRVNLHKY